MQGKRNHDFAHWPRFLDKFNIKSGLGAGRPEYLILHLSGSGGAQVLARFQTD